MKTSKSPAMVPVLRAGKRAVLKPLLACVLAPMVLAGCTGPAGSVKVTNTTDSESIPVHFAGKEKGRVKEYRLVVGKAMGENGGLQAIKDLQQQVNGMLDLGWQPLGGVSIAVDKDYRYTCSQAMGIIK